jgi:carboxymethylenebutenolidase
MKKLDAELTRLDKQHQFYTYPGANHGFMDFTGARHHQGAEEASWPRTLEFFAQYLKGAVVPR